MKYLIPIMILVFSCAVPANGQNIPLIHFSEEDGLAGNSVQDIIKDGNGFLWIATETGLSGYDGTSFKNFEKSNGLPNNLVRALAAGEKGRIYAGCYNAGLAEIENNVVKRVYHTTGKFPDSIRELHFSNSLKSLFIGTDHGLYILKDSSLIHIPVKDPTVKNSVLSFAEQGSRIFYTVHGSDDAGLYELLYDRSDPAKSVPVLVSRLGRFSMSIINDTLFASEYHKILAHPLKDIASQTAYASLDSAFLIWNMIPYKGGLLAGGFNDGRFNGNIALISRSKRSEERVPFKIDAQSVTATFMDSASGILWLGTDKGLFCIPQTPVKYSEFSGIKDIANYNDTLFVLRDDGVYFYLNNNFILLKSKSVIRETAGKSMRARNGLLTDIHRSFELNNFIIDNDELFLQTSEGAIAFPSFSKYVPFGKGIFKSIDGRSGYVQTGYIELRFYEDFDRIDKFSAVLSQDGTILNDISKIMKDDSVFYMISKTSGLTVIRNRKAYYYNESNSIIENSISDIAHAADGSVWISSAHGNLFKVSFSDSLAVDKILNQNKGSFRGTKIKWISFTPDYLFVATDKGLNLISAATLKKGNPAADYFFNAHNGYPFIESVHPAAGRDGKLYVHDSERLIEIGTEMPDRTTGDFYYPGISINDDSVSFSRLKSQKLPWTTKQVQIKFLQKKFPSARNLLYRYNVNGNQWISDNVITLQSPKPGKYTISIEAEDAESGSVSADTLDFFIAKPLFYEWWFIVSFAGLLLLLISFIFMQRIKSIRKEHNEKTRLIINNSELKLRSLQIQMNPHFIFNALNSIQYCILAGSAEDSLHYLSSLAKIIRKNLENADEEYILLSEEMDFLGKYISIEKLRFRDNLQISVTNEARDPGLMIPPMLVQPILENAIHHGIRNTEGTGIVSFRLMHEGDSLKIVIEDNGKTWNDRKVTADGKNKSLGISTIRKRLELLNAKYNTSGHRLTITGLLTDDDKPAGTRVELCLKARMRKQ